MRNLISACVLFLTFCFVPLLDAQRNGVDENSPAQPPSSSVNSGQPLQRMNVKTFTGKITKHGEDYALYDMATNLTIRLDNPSLASKYLGKEVSVVGELVAPQNFIRVQKIERAH